MGVLRFTKAIFFRGTFFSPLKIVPLFPPFWLFLFVQKKKKKNIISPFLWLYDNTHLIVFKKFFFRVPNRPDPTHPTPTLIYTLVSYILLVRALRTPRHTYRRRIHIRPLFGSQNSWAIFGLHSDPNIADPNIGRLRNSPSRYA